MAEERAKGILYTTDVSQGDPGAHIFKEMCQQAPFRIKEKPFEPTFARFAYLMNHLDELLPDKVDLVLLTTLNLDITGLEKAIDTETIMRLGPICNMPYLGGIQAVKLTKEKCPDIPCVVYSSVDAIVLNVARELIDLLKR
jgi:hypothetical protein